MIDEEKFNKICKLNPKDLRIDEQITIEYTNTFIEDKKNFEKKSFTEIDKNIVDEFIDRIYITEDSNIKIVFKFREQYNEIKHISLKYAFFML